MSSFNFKGKQFNINANMNCVVKNVIYVILCLLFLMNSNSIIDRNETEKMFIQKYKPDLNSLWRVLSRGARITFVAVIRPHRNSKDVTSQFIKLTLRNYLDNVSAYDYVEELFMALKIVNT